MRHGMAVEMRRRGLVLALAGVMLASSPAWAVKIAIYNLLNYDGTTRATQFKAITGGLQADILVVQEIANASAPDSFLNAVLNASGGPGGYAKATFVVGPDTSNALFYRTARFSFNASDPDSFRILPTALRDINRWKLRVAGYNSSAADIYVYAMHLKASQGYEAQRAAEAAIARNDANALPTGTNFVYAGDLNLYTSAEEAYSIQLTGSLADNDGRGFDPINRPGNWNNNGSFADIHTQSTCNGGTCAPGAATGGMDDRFDHLIVSAALKDGQGFDYVPATYMAYGNDGQHFNMAIDGGGFNNAVGLAMAQNLRLASDHLPVIADFKVPAKIAASAMAFGTAILGATAQKALTVTNTGDAALFGYVDPLNYTLPTAPAGFSGPTGSFVANAGAAGNDHIYSMDTAAVGSRSGTLAITSDADTPVVNVAFAGFVVTHARPSCRPDAEITAGSLDFGSHPVGHFGAGLAARVHNYGYSATQALLDVYAAEITGPDAAHFVFLDGVVPATVGASPAAWTIGFDDADVVPNADYTATLTFRTRDPADIIGGTSLSSVVYSLTAHVSLPCNRPTFDTDTDADVDLADFSQFQLCFGGANAPASPTCECADGDTDADVDLADFARFQLCFSGANTPADPACAD